MRCCLLAVAFALAAFGLFAKEANVTLVRSEPSGCMSDWTPFRISLAGPVALPWGNWNVTGLDVGIWNDAEEMDGLEIGIVNTTYRMRGLQIGAINIARNAYGVQVGVVNVIRSSDIPFIPVIHWCF